MAKHCYHKRKDVGFRSWNGWGSATQYEDIDTVSEYKNWAGWVSWMFGGPDIFAIDVQLEGAGKKPRHAMTGIHDTRFALADQHANEDAAALIDLVLKKVDARRKELKSQASFPSSILVA